jgi:hypothetical protein
VRAVHECLVDIDKMVRHLFYEEMFAAPGLRIRQQLAHNIVTVTIFVGEYFFPARVHRSRDAQKMTVKRFVNDPRIATLRKTVHERRRHVARTGPETNGGHRRVPAAGIFALMAALTGDAGLY